MEWECFKPFLNDNKTTSGEQLWYFQSVVIKIVTKAVFRRQMFRVETGTLLNIYFCVQDFSCTKYNKTTDICHKILTVNIRSLRHVTNINGCFLQCGVLFFYIETKWCRVYNSNSSLIWQRVLYLWPTETANHRACEVDGKLLTWHIPWYVFLKLYLLVYFKIK